MTTGRVEFVDPDTGAVIDSYMYGSIADGESLDVRDMVSHLLGIDTAPEALLARLETDPGYARAGVDLVPERLFQGKCGGRLDAIAAERIALVQDMCRAVQARIAAEEALR